MSLTFQPCTSGELPFWWVRDGERRILGMVYPRRVCGGPFCPADNTVLDAAELREIADFCEGGSANLAHPSTSLAHGAKNLAKEKP